MKNLQARIGKLSPKQRKLLELRMKREGLKQRPDDPGGADRIPRRPDPGPAELSFGQQRLWFIDRLAPESPAYNIPFAGRLAGSLDIGVLVRSLGEIVRRHEVLHSRFVEQEGRPVQVAVATLRVDVPLIDLSWLATADREIERQTRIDQEPQRLFDLTTAPMVRLTLLRLGTEDHTLLVTMPHIVTDAWSMAVFFRELPAIYDAFRCGQPSPLPPLPIQVADHAVWQRRQLADGERLEKDRAFWEAQLAEAPSVLDLPTDHPRPPVQSLRGRRHAIAVPDAVTRSLRQVCEERGLTPFMALLAGFFLMLSRYSGQRDLLAGSPFALRGPAETQGLIGFFINIAVLRGDLRGPISGVTLLDRVRQMTFGTLAHQEYPFERLVESHVGSERDLSRPPLVQAYFVLQNVHIPNPEFEALQVTSVQQTDTRSARVDLTLGLWEGEGIQGWFEYNVALFDRTTITRMCRHYVEALRYLTTQTEAPIHAATLLTASDRQQMLVEWNDRTRDFPGESRLERLTAEQAARRPDAVAWVSGDEQSSYGMLIERSEALAWRLAAHGVGGDAVVALAMERSPVLLPAMLAILRVGAAYLPVDPSYPEARLRAMLTECGVDLAIADEPFAGCSCAVLPPDVTGPPAPNLDRPFFSGGDALAYVIYTSGSTGRPKGIAVPHRAVVRLVWDVDYVRLDASQILLQAAPLSFDAATFEIWGSLLRGGRLVLAPSAPTLESLGEEIVRQRVSTLWLTAGLFHAMVEERLEDLASVRQLLAGGDVVSPNHGRRVLERHPNLRLIDGYGPSESTTFACTSAVARPSEVRSPLPIGRPLANTRTLILDRELRPRLLGAIGELCIGGEGLARGYVGQPRRTAERFVPDPLGRLGARLYRSGDRARQLTDGQIEFLGRRDLQVKVRGFRVELEEIEVALDRNARVRSAAVVARPLGAGTVGLAAFCVLDGEDVEPSSLRESLLGQLPEYMVPSQFIALDSLPLTANGKIDRQTLRRHPLVNEAQPKLPKGYATGDLENRLSELWREVLGRETLGVHDNFFDLGGDSILALQLISRARRLGLEFDPEALFTHPTVASLAQVVDARSAVEDRCEVVGEVPLLPIQRWFFDLNLACPEHWNMAVLLRVGSHGRARMGRLNVAVARLLQHHDQLRVRFGHQDGVWRQQVHPSDGDSPTHGIDLSRLEAAQFSEAVERLCVDVQRSLNLGSGPLLRVVWIDGGAGRGGRLLLVIHHLVVDGVSWRVLLEDLHQLLDGSDLDLASKSTSFQDWARILERLVAEDDENWEAAQAFWREMEVRAMLDPPATGGLALEATAEHCELSLTVSETEDLLRQAPEAYKTRVDDLLLTALVDALDRRGYGRVASIELEGHGRESGLANASVDLTRTVGWFTSAYPVVFDLRDVVDLGAAIQVVKERRRAVPSGGVGYGVWASRLDVTRPELSFNYLGQLDGALGADWTLARESTGPLRSGKNLRSQRVDVTAFVLEGRLGVVWTWSRAMDRREELEALAHEYLDALREVIAHCLDPESGGRTPSDFPAAQLDQAQLDRLFGH